MPLDDQQRKLIEAALAQKLTATRSDLLKKFPLEITVSPEYIGYFNPRVTVLVDSSVAFEVTHLKFTPVPEAGFVAVEPAWRPMPVPSCSPAATAAGPAASR